MTYAPIIFAMISCVISLVALIRNSKADTKKDAGQMTEIMVKLERKGLSLSRNRLNRHTRG